MLEKIKYINHLNEQIVLGEAGVFVNISDIHDYAWDVQSKNNKISGFAKSIVTMTLPVIIVAKSATAGIKKRNDLFEIFEKDVLANKHGRLIIGDYYLRCFISGSKKSDYLVNKRYLSTALTVVTDYPAWVKETKTSFGYNNYQAGQNMDFNRDFPVDYTSNLIGTQLENNSFSPSNFKMTIYGPCIDPHVTIGGHVYSVDVELGADEYLTIDSTDKTILKTDGEGNKTNCFAFRNRESYVFEKIKSGSNRVSISGDYLFDITVLDERGEPKWT